MATPASASAASSAPSGPASSPAPTDVVATGTAIARGGAEMPATGRAVARNSATMAAGSMVGRVTGLLRTVAIGAAIGGALVGNDYALANNLPNMVYELLLGGVLSAAVVPMLVRARADSDDGGQAYAQRLLTAATVGLALATALAVGAAPLLTHLIATGAPAADRHLVTMLGYLLLPEIFFYGLAALCGAVLNSRGRFAAPMWTPILNNVVVIVTAGIFVLLPTVSHPPDPETITARQILVLGIGTTLGIVVQAAGLLPAMHRSGFRWRWRFDWASLHLGQVGRIAGWTLCYVAVNQIAVVIVLNIANHAKAPGPAVYNNAYLMVMMVYGIVAVSITTALTPRMAAAWHTDRKDEHARLVTLGIRMGLVVLIPATLLFALLGRQIGVTLFEFGNFSHTNSVQTGWVIVVGAASLIPFALNQLQVISFYAMGDTRTPALANVPVAATRIGIDLVLYAALPRAWVVAGLMAGNAISYTAGAVIYARLLRLRLGALPMTPVYATARRLTAAGAVAAFVAGALLIVWVPRAGLAKWPSLMQAVTAGTLIVGVYLLVAYRLRTSEVRDLISVVTSRLRRSADRTGA